MTCDVFVVGSLHMDVVVNAPHLPALDETVAGSRVAYQFGGKGGNQAVAAAQFGAQTAMAGRVGKDEFASHLLDHLSRSGVDACQIQTGVEASGMSVAIVNSDGNYGAVIVSAANLEIEAGQITVPSGTRVLLLQNEIPEAVNIALAEKARAAGVQVILNAAPARPTSDVFLALVDILVVNRGEAASMSGQTQSASDPSLAAEALLNKGPRTVLVTLGSQGMLCRYAKGDGFDQAALAVDVISTHGAGDAFIGALAAQLAKNVDIKDATGFAQTAAALHVSMPVGDRSSVSPESVRALLAERATVN